MVSPNEPPPSDRQLVMAAQTGSREAWAALVERYYAPVRRYLTGQLHDPDAAVDLTHDVFLAALALLDRAPTDRPFVPWLFRIAQNHLKRGRRRDSRARRVVSLDGLIEGAGEQTVPALRQLGDIGIEVTEREQIGEVLAALSPRLCRALLLHALKGQTAREVAEVLGVSVGAAEKQISRAKAEFSARYNALADQDAASTS